MGFAASKIIVIEAYTMHDIEKRQIFLNIANRQPDVMLDVSSLRYPLWCTINALFTHLKVL